MVVRTILFEELFDLSFRNIFFQKNESFSHLFLGVRIDKDIKPNSWLLSLKTNIDKIVNLHHSRLESVCINSSTERTITNASHIIFEVFELEIKRKELLGSVANGLGLHAKWLVIATDPEENVKFNPCDASSTSTALTNIKSFEEVLNLKNARGVLTFVRERRHACGKM